MVLSPSIGGAGVAYTLYQLLKEECSTMDEVILRAVERLVAVLIGGLGVYLGYRLFLCIPEQREGEGKIEFPGGASIFVTRVGPGVFFAMFGAAIVGLSLQKGIVSSHHSPNSERTVYQGIAPAASAIAPEAQQLDQLKLRSHIEFLNALPTWLKADLGEAERREVTIRREEVKLLLMEQVWSQGWGSFETFRLWVESGAQDPVPTTLMAAAQYFRAGQEATP
jgi:hypothetical protein